MRFVYSCFILCLCCDGTTTGVVVPFFVTLLQPAFKTEYVSSPIGFR